MPLRFTYASGSPPAWKVWLALEHKEIAYELQLVSFQHGDLKKPEFLAKNPRGKVPFIEDDGLVLWESSAILEYLEDKYPDKPLLPRDVPARARIRRLAVEADLYFHPAARQLLFQTLYRPDGGHDPAEIALAREEVLRECARFDAELGDGFFGGAEVSLADFAVYPVTALIRRVDVLQPENGIGDALGGALAAWMKRVEALPYFARTLPPHWKVD